MYKNLNIFENSNMFKSYNKQVIIIKKIVRYAEFSFLCEEFKLSIQSLAPDDEIRSQRSVWGICLSSDSPIKQERKFPQYVGNTISAIVRFFSILSLLFFCCGIMFYPTAAGLDLYLNLKCEGGIQSVGWPSPGAQIRL